MPSLVEVLDFVGIAIAVIGLYVMIKRTGKSKQEDTSMKDNSAIK